MHLTCIILFNPIQLKKTTTTMEAECVKRHFLNTPQSISHGIFLQVALLLTERKNDTYHPRRLDEERKIWAIWWTGTQR